MLIPTMKVIVRNISKQRSLIQHQGYQIKHSAVWSNEIQSFKPT